MSEIKPFYIEMIIEVVPERIVTCVVGVVELAASPWLNEFILQECTPNPEFPYTEEDFEHPWYADERLWRGDFKIAVKYDGPKDEEGTFASSKILTRGDFHKGLKKMAKEYPISHFRDLVEENDDAITHDIFMQFVILGEVIYG